MTGLRISSSSGDWLNLTYTEELWDLKEQNEILRKHVIDFFCVALSTAPSCLSQDHWDFILCSLVSWLKVCVFIVQSLNERLNHFICLLNFIIVYSKYVYIFIWYQSD